MSALQDAAARERALDLSTSFCIRAPAGSGKTGLLICRMLAALAVVDHPEQVLAITFTRKAAAEIRDRLTQALESAASADAPEDDYARTLHTLARKVRLRSDLRGWELTSNPHRIRASTIDSLNRDLARQMPVLSGLGGPLEPLDDARELYRSALQQVLQLHEDGALEPSLRDSIGHVLALGKNRLDTLLSSLSPLLAQREQWATQMLHTSMQSVQQVGEKHLQQWVTRSLETIDRCLPCAPRAQWLQTLQQHADAGLPQWQALMGLSEWPAPVPEKLNAWQTLARSLLTNSGQWRKPAGLRVTSGFPAGPVTKQAQTLLPEFTENTDPQLPRLLSRLLLLPTSYDAQMAHDALHLLTVLRLALAQLKVDFAQRNSCDHTELALAARFALRAEDRDIAAQADARYQHILIDEMQDTSNAQLELLEQLVADWQTGDGRSLFLVGDPQQSIYLFRQARVEKFNALLQPGAQIGPVALQPLELSQNFRSSAPLVAWCNQALGRVFREQASPIPFAASTAQPADTSVAESPVSLICEDTPEAEAAAAANRIQELLAANADTHIGVLARTRVHLRPLARRLRHAGVAFSGVELEALRDTPAIRNYIAIVRVLHHPEDDFASMRLLRTPGIGLSWAQCDELVTLSPQHSWSQRLRQPLSQAASSELVERWSRLHTALQAAERRLQTEGDLPVAARMLYHALRLPESLSAAELRDVQRFERHLRAACVCGLLRDEDAFLRSLDGLWADTDATRIELMTVHKSKGLEFDQVLIVGMGRAGRGGEEPLLAWHPDTGGAALALRPQAPFDAQSGDGCLYRWLRQEHKDAEGDERLRLLYVAVTRARFGLHLCMSADARSGSLGAPLKSILRWPEPQDPSLVEADSDETPTWVSVLHPRLAQAAARPRPRGFPTPPRLHAPPPSRLGATDRGLVASSDSVRLEASLVGSSVHEALERLALRGLESWESERKPMLRALAAGLARRGLPLARRQAAMAQIEGLVDRAATGQGRRLLQPHPWHRTEYAISGMVNGRLIQGIIDRCFETAEGELWVVDYKTNTPPAETTDIAPWHAELVQTYAEQLARYAQLLAVVRPGHRTLRQVLYLVTRDELLELLPGGYKLL